MNILYNSRSDFFYNVLEQYKLTTAFNSSRIRQDLTKEQSTSKDYKGREIYELIQNAEDEKSDSVRIELDTATHLLTVANTGIACSPFSEDGFCSIMMAEMSPKMVEQKNYIGCKGLGFRSLINWAEEICIQSGGVSCSFSREIAQWYWNEIKSGWGNTLIQQHEDFARKEFHLVCPLPMLSVPKVEDISMDQDYVTKIIVKYKPACLDSIKKQLESLSGKILLFLKNIKRIEVCVDGNEDVISCEKDCGDGSQSVRNITTYDNTHRDGQKWIVYHTSGFLGKDKRYEISLAFDPESKESGNVVYTFFPTRVRLSLPLVLHATFELNSSRNSINESDVNNEMQCLIAKKITLFAETLAGQNQEKDTSWIYYDCTLLKEVSEQNEFPILYEELEKNRESAGIYPTIAKGYLPYAQTLHYNEAWASFLMLPCPFVFEGMERHLVNGYAERCIHNQSCDFELANYVDALSLRIEEQDKENIIYRAQLITSLKDIQGCTKFKVLVDNEYNIIEKEARINVGESIPYLPTEMNITYVSEELIAKLIETMHIEESAQKRAVTKQLRKNSCADVSDMDISTAKRSIITYSKNMMTLEGFRQLMFALYMKSQENEADCNFKEMCQNQDFCVFDAEGNKRFPSEVVIKTADHDDIYDLRHQLHETLPVWTELFSLRSGKPQEENDVKNFFYNIIGISTFVPQNYCYLNDEASDFLKKYCVVFKNQEWQHRRYYSNNFTPQKNQYRIAKQEFLDSLIQEKGFSLAQVIQLIKKDKTLVQDLQRTEVWYSYNGTKRDEFEIGYTAFIMRSWNIFQPLQSYIVSERLCLEADTELENQLSKMVDDYETVPLLVLLGAKARLDCLKNDELYRFLRLLPDKKLSKGVRPIYKTIREAILGNQNRNELTESIGLLVDDFVKEGKVYARKNGGELTVKPVSEVFYWDNDQLPKQLLQSKWKLEIGNRVGEKSVKEIFGVRLASEISIKIGENIPNRELKNDVLQNLHNRCRYILAYRFHNSREINEKGRIQLANSLKDIQLYIYNNCTYINEEKVLSMNEGDMITQNEGKGIIFHLCAKQKTFTEAIKSPVFCENIMEVLCMTLKVTSNEMANAFRSILKNTEEENIYVSKREITDEEWGDVDKALGLSVFEKFFWKKVAQGKKVDIDFSQLSQPATTKIKYLKDILPGISLPNYFDDLQQLSPEQKYDLLRSLGITDATIWGKDGLLEYYQKIIRELHLSYRNSYSRYWFEKINNAPAITNKADALYKRYQEYDHKDFNDIAKEMSLGVHDIIELEEKFKQCILASFDECAFQLSPNDPWVPQQLETYKNILIKMQLNMSVIDQHDLCYTCFEGYEAEFQRIVNKYISTDEDSGLHTSGWYDEDETEKRIPMITFGIAQDKNYKKQNHKGRDNGKGYQSESRKLELGRVAEKLVYKAMQADKEHFQNVTGCSRNLDPINGNDDLHYDISYSPIINGEVGPKRFLEVKSMTSDYILMSAAEHQFAQEHKEDYDFALVKNEEIYFIPRPFAPTDGRPSLTAYPDTMKVTLSISSLVNPNSR